MLSRAASLLLLWLAASHSLAFQSGQPAAPSTATGTIQHAFTPGDRADEMIIAAIDMARYQVLVQAYSFSHRRIGDALVRAHRRGVDVAMIVDEEQARAAPTVIRNIARSGAAVMFDARHAAAHNKIMLIDAGHADCAVVTGSFNYTYAAQHRNAENVLIVRGNAPLCSAYFDNWRHHQSHAHAPAR